MVSYFSYLNTTHLLMIGALILSPGLLGCSRSLDPAKYMPYGAAGYQVRSTSSGVSDSVIRAISETSYSPQVPGNKLLPEGITFKFCTSAKYATVLVGVARANPD